MYTHRPRPQILALICDNTDRITYYSLNHPQVGIYSTFRGASEAFGVKYGTLRNHALSLQCPSHKAQGAYGSESCSKRDG